MNRRKEEKVRELLDRWRTVAVQVAHRQWRHFFEEGRFRKNSLDKSLASLIGAARLQMVRYQVVGLLSSWVTNRQREFARVVERSSVSEERRHRLHVVNCRRAWFLREAITMPDGQEIPESDRRLARKIMKRVMRRHQRPCFRRVGMVIDRRGGTFRSAEGTIHFDYWYRLSTLAHGERIEVPLRGYPYFERRRGKRKATLQVSEAPDGALIFSVVTDVSEAFRESRAAYQPRTEALALDFGLCTIFATDQGDLLGRRHLQYLKRADERITRLARHRQRMGLPVSSPRYQREVARLRGYLRTEVGRVLNRLVEIRRPEHLVLEGLYFQQPGLSRRMNRLLSWCGRGMVRAKLRDLEEKYGITYSEVPAAYSSQECAACQYVDRRNRSSRKSFECLWCRKRSHADVNAARVIGRRRSSPIGPVWQAKAKTLCVLVRRHVERHPEPRIRRSGHRGMPADPRLTNPYFREWQTRVTSMLPPASAILVTGSSSSLGSSVSEAVRRSR